MTNNAKIGGILSIVAGGLGCIGALVMVMIIALMWSFADPGSYYYDYSYEVAPERVFGFLAVIYGVMALIGVCISALAIVGGINALRKKNWGLALAGAIAGALAFFPCGIPAIIFITIGKLEFGPKPQPMQTSIPI